MIENKPYFEPKESGNDIADAVAAFTVCMQRGDSPDSPAAQSLVEQWRACHNDQLNPDSISEDVEAYGSGTRNFMKEAIAFYKKGH